MSTYATVPEVGEQSSKPSTLGFKKVVAGAAVATFLLGSLAAVVVAGGSAPPVYELSSIDEWHKQKHKIKLHGKKFPNGDNVCLGFEHDPDYQLRDQELIGSKLLIMECRNAPAFLWSRSVSPGDVWKLTYNNLCVTGHVSPDFPGTLDSSPYFALMYCVDTPDQYVGYYGNENDKLHASLSHWDNGDCIGVRATVRPDGGNELHVGKLVERFECPSGEYRHVYTDWHME